MRPCSHLNEFGYALHHAWPWLLAAGAAVGLSSLIAAAMPPPWRLRLKFVATMVLGVAVGLFTVYYVTL